MNEPKKREVINVNGQLLAEGTRDYEKHKIKGRLKDGNADYNGADRRYLLDQLEQDEMALLLVNEEFASSHPMNEADREAFEAMEKVLTMHYGVKVEVHAKAHRTEEYNIWEKNDDHYDSLFRVLVRVHTDDAEKLPGFQKR